jgi:hypothetical protein
VSHSCQTYFGFSGSDLNLDYGLSDDMIMRSIVSHSCQTYFGFPGSDLNLDYGLRDHMIMRFVSVA